MDALPCRPTSAAGPGRRSARPREAASAAAAVTDVPLDTSGRADEMRALVIEQLGGLVVGGSGDGGGLTDLFGEALEAAPLLTAWRTDTLGSGGPPEYTFQPRAPAAGPRTQRFELRFIAADDAPAALLHAFAAQLGANFAVVARRFVAVDVAAVPWPVAHAARGNVCTYTVAATALV